MGEGERLARESFGENSTILAKGDLNENGLPDIFSVIINKKIDENRYWIQKGGILEDDKGWRFILNIDTRLSSTKGNMVNMIDANNGYIIGFDSNEKPMAFYISIADSAGNSISDEALIKWNDSEKTYEFIPNPGVNDNDDH
jgi:hypothetical protein